MTAEATISALDTRAPRYTSYPTADRFVESFDARAQADRLARRGGGAQPAPGRGNPPGAVTTTVAPLSLYVHVPFCESLCWYCACNKVVTRDHGRATPYLDHLEREADLVLSVLGGSRRVSQVHWGGGSPTFLDRSQATRLMQVLRDRFDFAAHGDYSIEVDPRTLAAHDVAPLARLGFNRMSLGVQDFDEAVQRAVNRVQPAALTLSIVRAARDAGFGSINFDLIYGLPRQSLAGFDRTLSIVAEARPERIALYHYAHLPQRFRAQRLIEPAGLPDAATRLAIMALARRRLTEAGYQHIGIDHFALPDDDLAIARRSGRLHRNFQGYTTQPECDLIGLGVSAISKVGAAYSQNLRTVPAYYAALARGELPVWRGIALSPDDLARRELIMALMCGSPVDLDDIATRHGLLVERDFADELVTLARLRDAGLVALAGHRLAITDSGLPYVRAISATFDRHLRQGPVTASYSRVV